MRRIRTAVAVAAAAALLGGATACGGDGGRERTPQEAFQASAKVMAAAGAAKVALVRQDPADGPSSGSGVLSWGSKPALDLVLDRGSGEVAVRTLDGVVYLGADAAQTVRMGGRRWMKFDPEKSSGGNSEAAGYSTWSEQLDPVSDLAALAEVGTLQRLGEERLGDVHTVHYRGTATIRALVGATGDLTAAQRVSVLGAYLRQGATSVTADIWINDKDEVVQERKTCKVAKGEAITSTRYSEIGTEVNIQAPLPDDTFDLADADPGNATG
ncbi:hypothetical protein [Peterkaempfera bronchialis]|uniref:Lipoprotein n=1 Tax=Peterkaempfera bronchialis TaxID=2126346 RepID=A0A345SWG9_9ACTN|nr:hypothetical protein [Peterkaempfera bronchialis]AXI78074.1 hypothetical protein C7M71_012095 [Peterkaempfera bronchialis]